MGVNIARAPYFAGHHDLRGNGVGCGGPLHMLSFDILCNEGSAIAGVVFATKMALSTSCSIKQRDQSLSHHFTGSIQLAFLPLSYCTFPNLLRCPEGVTRC